MPGHEQVFVDRAMRRDLICPLCRLAMKEAVTLITCRHSFCESCLREFLSDGINLCPVDNSKLDYTQIFPDELKRGEILSSLVQCPFFKDGCRWINKLKRLKSHVDMCRYEVVLCPNSCGARLSKAVLNDHIKYTCPQRKVTCPACRQEFTGNSLEAHEGNCAMEPVWCEHKCGARVPRRHLKKHMQNDCVKRTASCNHCLKQFLYETLQDHYLQCPQFPVSCPNQCDLGLKISREELGSHIGRECPSAVVPCTFKEIGCKHLGTRTSLERHLDESVKHHLLLTACVVTAQQLQIDELTHQLHQSACVTDGTFIWKVTNFRAKLGKAKTVEDFQLRSIPFYTGRHGYRLGMSLFPGGNGSGEKTHLSVYISVVPGEYDNILEWPFRLPIVFKLLDQCSDPEKQQHVVESFIPNPSWKQFQKPSKDEENSGFGYPKFVTIETLLQGTYIRDDAIFIKVKVDLSRFVEP